jgi:hypothetical protein
VQQKRNYINMLGKLAKDLEDDEPSVEEDKPAAARQDRKAPQRPLSHEEAQHDIAAKKRARFKKHIHTLRVK